MKCVKQFARAEWTDPVPMRPLWSSNFGGPRDLAPSTVPDAAVVASQGRVACALASVELRVSACTWSSSPYTTKTWPLQNKGRRGAWHIGARGQRPTDIFQTALSLASFSCLCWKTYCRSDRPKSDVAPFLRHGADHVSACSPLQICLEMPAAIGLVVQSLRVSPVPESQKGQPAVRA